MIDKSQTDLGNWAQKLLGSLEHQERPDKRRSTRAGKSSRSNRTSSEEPAKFIEALIELEGSLHKKEFELAELRSQAAEQTLKLEQQSRQALSNHENSLREKDRELAKLRSQVAEQSPKQKEQAAALAKLENSLHEKERELAKLRLQAAEQTHKQEQQASLNDHFVAQFDFASLQEHLADQLSHKLSDQLSGQLTGFVETALQQVISQHEQGLSAIQGTVQSQLTQAIATQSSNHELAEDYRLLQSENSRLESSFKELNDLVEFQKLQIEELTNKAAAECQEYREQLERLKSELEQSTRSRELSDDETQTELENVRAELECVQYNLTENQEELANVRDQLYEASDALEKSKIEISELTALIEASPTQIAELRQITGDEPSESQQAEIDELKAEVESLQDTLASLRSQQGSNRFSELEKLRCENQDLRTQNSDLASQVAQFQMSAVHDSNHLTLSNESLTWEERKKLILAQLDRECEEDAGSTDSKNKRLEVTEVLAEAQSQVDYYKQQIDELQRVASQQANFQGGVAIGAAAIAQRLEADELIQEEREKLRLIQTEWEDKLRQAEIDISLERAKLARERAQLEQQLREQLTCPVPTEPIKTQKPENKPEGKPVRKWLQQLGLNNKD